MSDLFSLRRFVSDFLHTTLEFSDDATIEYLIEEAKQSKNYNEIISNLETCEIPLNDYTKNFAKTLFDKIPRNNEEKLLENKKKKWSI